MVGGGGHDEPGRRRDRGWPESISVVGHVPRVDGSNLSYEEFEKQYMRPNRPVLVFNLGLEEWRAAKEWTRGKGDCPACSHDVANSGDCAARNMRGEGHSCDVFCSCRAPDLELLSREFGDSAVQVADCGERQFTDQERSGMSMREYAQWWTDMAMRAEPDPRGGSLLYLKDWHFSAEYPQYDAYATPKYFQDDWLNAYLDSGALLHDPSRHARRTEWLKDWKERRGRSSNERGSFPGGEQPGESPTNQDLPCQRLIAAEQEPATYEVGLEKGPPSLCVREQPSPAEGDRLSNSNKAQGTSPSASHSDQAAGCCADYRFVYLGPKGSWTPLHADVLHSFSWSANVCGRKRWLLLSPEQTPLIVHRHSRATVYDIEDHVDPTHFPKFHETRWLEAVQGPGEAMFVPCSWYHQVTNLENTLSINHNWINSCSIANTWRLLEKDRAEAAEQISDVWDLVARGLVSAEEHELLVQRNLAANSGMNYDDFLAFLTFFLASALLAVLALRPSTAQSLPRGIEHRLSRPGVDARKAIFQLRSLNAVLVAMAESPYFCIVSGCERQLRREEAQQLAGDLLAKFHLSSGHPADCGPACGCEATQNSGPAGVRPPLCPTDLESHIGSTLGALSLSEEWSGAARTTNDEPDHVVTNGDSSKLEPPKGSFFTACSSCCLMLRTADACAPLSGFHSVLTSWLSSAMCSTCKHVQSNLACTLLGAGPHCSAFIAHEVVNMLQSLP